MLSVGEKVMVIYSFEVSEYINQKMAVLEVSNFLTIIIL